VGETASGRNGEWACGRVGVMERSTVEDGLPRRRLCGGGRTTFAAGALVGFAEEDATGAGGAGEDAFSGRFVLEIGVGRDAADSDL